MRWVAAGGVTVRELPTTAVDETATLLEKYDDLPIDLADATLVWLAGEMGIAEVVTLDETDFGIYRLPAGNRLTNLLAL